MWRHQHTADGAAGDSAGFNGLASMGFRSTTRAVLRSLVLLLAVSAGTLVAACASSGGADAEYVVIESDKFT